MISSKGLCVIPSEVSHHISAAGGEEAILGHECQWGYDKFHIIAASDLQLGTAQTSLHWAVKQLIALSFQSS